MSSAPTEVGGDLGFVAIAFFLQQIRRSPASKRVHMRGIVRSETSLAFIRIGQYPD